jgi:hypothetical protein
VHGHRAVPDPAARVDEWEQAQPDEQRGQDGVGERGARPLVLVADRRLEGLGDRHRPVDRVQRVVERVLHGRPVGHGARPDQVADHGVQPFGHWFMLSLTFPRVQYFAEPQAIGEFMHRP